MPGLHIYGRSEFKFYVLSVPGYYGTRNINLKTYILIGLGTLKGFDQTINLILDETHERVFSTSQGVEQVS